MQIFVISFLSSLLLINNFYFSKNSKISLNECIKNGKLMDPKRKKTSEHIYLIARKGVGD